MAKSLKAFLTYLKNSPELFTHSPVKVVCGNASADFDSVASAITYAYCSYQKDPQHPIIPIVNIPKVDLSLRRDIVRALDGVCISEDLLFFIEDLQQIRNKTSSLTAVLVDHNKIEFGVADCIENVSGIIDHHKDENLYLNADPRIIETTGSCSSLVMNYWAPHLDDPTSIKDVALLSLSAALIDTSNFRHKVEQPDLDALQIYSRLLPSIDREEHYNKIRRDKDDLDGLTIQEILRKDYKQFLFETAGKNQLKIGIASVVKPLKWFYDEFGGESSFTEACSECQKENDVDIYVVLTSWVDKKEFKRELAIMSTTFPNDGLLTIVKTIKDKLQLDGESQITSESSFASFQQLNVSASRKQVAPILKDAVESIN